MVFITPLSAILLALLSAFSVFYSSKKSKKSLLETGGLKKAPSPLKLPVIGHLHLLGGYKVPYQAFTDLGKKYGDVVKLQLGNVKCVVINGQKNIREALISKGNHFDSRPGFQRYQLLFSGNKENSLAFCNWSSTQKTRRDMLKAHTFPRPSSKNYSTLEVLIQNETGKLVQNISQDPIALKPLILQHCANIFTSHFCSRTFPSSSSSFKNMVDSFDSIFFEVNQGYAADFLPFLLPLHSNNLKKMQDHAHRIRKFILDEIVEDRYEQVDLDQEPRDYLESLIQHVRKGEDMDWETALFALEDIVGGHSAVGNFLVKVFAFLVERPQVQKSIQKEIDSVCGERELLISDRASMPYTEAAILEAVRLIASPIVPRVANQDSSIDGFHIEKDSVLFLNNYALSMSNELWKNPEEFQPERFIQGGRLLKPEHFLPFGGGRRSCMGYKMVQLVSFGIVGGILQKFNIISAPGEDYSVMQGSLALPSETYKFKFVKR